MDTEGVDMGYGQMSDVMSIAMQATFSRLHRRVEEVVAGVAASYGCKVSQRKVPLTRCSV